MPRPHLDIGEDIAQQRKVWRIERIAWTLMGATIVAALLGFIGHGSFSRREAATLDSGLVVSWHRFERYHAQSQLTIELVDVTEAETGLRLGHDFLASVEIISIEPEPERVELDTAYSTYFFNTRAPGPILVNFKPVKPGGLELAVGREDGPMQRLPLFVYP